MKSSKTNTMAAHGLTRRQALQLAGAAALLPGFAQAQAAYPAGPVNLIIPLPPGGVVDVLARGLSDTLRANTGHPFVIENVPGATGILGNAKAAHSKPDGYTALLTISSPVTTSVFMVKDLPFNPDTDLEPVIITAQVIDALVVHKSLPINTLEEYIAYAKANPGQLSYATPGVGSPHHICGEMLQELAGIQLTHVPYKGSNEATADLIAGHVPSGIVAIGGVIEQAKAGNVKILATTEDKRVPQAPDLITIAEVVPGFGMAPAPWTGIFVPAGTPPEVIAVLNEQANLALKDPAFVQRLSDIFLFPVGGTPEDVRAKVTHERALTKAVVDRLGIQPK